MFSENSKNLYVTIFGPWAPIALQASAQNTQRVEKIASSVLNNKEYPRYKEFVETFAREHPLRLENEFRHTPIRQAYLSFKELPDSTAVETVGTLSEVVADATNRLDFNTDAAGKKFSWQTSLFLKEQGLDSVPLEVRLAAVEYELERLADVATNSPEILSEVHDMVKSFLLFYILGLILILGVPFYLGYLLGKRSGNRGNGR
ncbi:MAG: hypothetical protein P8Z38_01265 [Robiginitalea sp.]